MNEKWDGKSERRFVEHIICKQEEVIKAIHESSIRTEGRLEKLDLRINGTLEKMAVHTEDSTYWRRFIMGTAISLVITIIGGILTMGAVTFNLGEYTRQIKINTHRLDEVEEFHEQLRKAESKMGMRGVV